MTPLLNERAAALLLDVHVQTLRSWRRDGRGPPHVKMERCVRYDQNDIRIYIEDNLHQKILNRHESWPCRINKPELGLIGILHGPTV